MNKYIVLIFLSLCFACKPKKEHKLTIACAANMQFALQEIQQIFEKKTGIQTDVIISSSGKLTAQILSGAPFDVFLSADTKYPKTLNKKGMALSTPRIYAKGQLVLWSTTENTTPNLKNLTKENIQHIALANPKTAPYGVAALQVLNSLPTYNTLTSKFVYGESISQTNQFIISKTAQIGFTAYAVVLSPKLKDQGKWMLIPKNLYTPIQQSLVITKHAKPYLQEAQNFVSFIFSEKGKKILKKYGYLVN